MGKLVCESLNEFINSRDNEIRYAGHYIPPEYSSRFESPQEKRKRIAKEKIESNTAYMGKFKTIQELINSKPQDNDWILRSADGDGSLILFNGDLATKEDVNKMKTYYHYAEDINYMLARPITYKEWLKLDAQHKMASRRKKE
jgi:hypothetical protein